MRANRGEFRLRLLKSPNFNADLGQSTPKISARE
jgi:hypothetical protein